MLNGLAPGEVVTVTRIDRLARSTFDLFAIVKRVVNTGGAIQVAGGAVARHQTGRLMIAVLGGLAYVERGATLT